MKLIRILVATALAAALLSLLGLAQSPTENVCATDCNLEYERSVEKCTGADRDACVNNAASAYRTCMATCPGEKR